MKLLNVGMDGTTLALLLADEDGQRWVELDDVEGVRTWGNAYVIHCTTRDPVIIRADGQVHTLVIQG